MSYQLQAFDLTPTKGALPKKGTPAQIGAPFPRSPTPFPRSETPTKRALPPDQVMVLLSKEEHYPLTKVLDSCLRSGTSAKEEDSLAKGAIALRKAWDSCLRSPTPYSRRGTPALGALPPTQGAGLLQVPNVRGSIENIGSPAQGVGPPTMVQDPLAQEASPFPKAIGPTDQSGQLGLLRMEQDPLPLKLEKDNRHILN